ncbi:MAG: hypothetical protein ABIQ60_00760 [Burkholderiaceae bacterium]
MSGGGGGLIGLLIAAIIFVIPAWKIVEKAGYRGAWALLVLIPMVNIIAVWVFAFSQWPRGRAGNS